ncbi:MAG: HAD family hydrolase [Bacteroidota bacterium]
MRIAFDLDGTLIDRRFRPEKLKYPIGKLFMQEYLRKGVREVAAYLKKNKVELWVYTTSLRSSGYIRRLFFVYGISLNEVINQKIHDKAMKTYSIKPKASKYPPHWDISLLVDDQKGLELEAKIYEFEVYILSPSDLAWPERIIAAIERKLSIK